MKPSNNDVELTIHVLGLKEPEANNLREYWRDEVWAGRARRIGLVSALFGLALLGFVLGYWAGHP